MFKRGIFDSSKRINILYRNVFYFSIMIATTLIFDLINQRFNWEFYFMWLPAMIDLILIYLLTFRYPTNLFLHYFILILPFFLYFSLLGWYSGGTVNWTSYIIYFGLSLPFGLLFVFVSTINKKQYQE
ncbi:hypothetical protein KUA55_07350 [Enterococcus sp. ALS3]|uniref:DUF805 domain-containing protein n=1 Tax=Enterococcus alishanensis TaxID=1303817 RepID=A0ABS6TC57_9ENTE|nr:hypothetical protein [Enterococcus alishanensis]MBV7390490.1 hypothetical protein [Enterococcus alishanensis]